MDSRTTGPTTREELILAVHSLFDAQVGEPRGYMNLPQQPQYVFTDNYPSWWDTRDHLVYSTLAVTSHTEENCVQAMWEDLKHIWLLHPDHRPRLYWRYVDRIKLTREGGPWWMRLLQSNDYQLRTRISVPGYEDWMHGLFTFTRQGGTAARA